MILFTFVLYRVSGKKVSKIIEFFVGITLKIQLKWILFFQIPCIVFAAEYLIF